MTSPKYLLVLALLILPSCNTSSRKPVEKDPLPPGVQQTHSGLRHKLLRPGDGGATPNSLSTVKVHYLGKTKDGKVFDSSYERGKPGEFPLDRVIAGWTEGLQYMTKGEKRRFWIPSKLAYGDYPGAGNPAGELTFDIELLDFHQ